MFLFPAMCKHFLNSLQLFRSHFATDIRNIRCRVNFNKEEKMADVGAVGEPQVVENSVEIETLAKFAVDEHNKKENASLEFAKVVSAKEQVVQGKMYYITLEANDGKTYEAKIWVKPWEDFKELQEFNATA